MRNAKDIILEVAKDFEQTFGRKYSLYEKYQLDDAEIAVVVIGSTAGTAKVIVNELRSKGIKAGLLKIRIFRPFPTEQIAQDLAHIKAIAVMDRADSCSGTFAPLYSDVISSLYSTTSAGVLNPRTLSPEVGTLPLDYGGRSQVMLLNLACICV